MPAESPYSDELSLRSGSSKDSPKQQERSRPSARRSSSISDTSLILEHLNNQDPYMQKLEKNYDTRYRDTDPLYKDEFEELDVEDPAVPRKVQPVNAKYKRWLWLFGSLCLSGWLVALVLFVLSGSYKHRSTIAHDPDAIVSAGSGKKITLDQLQTGYWYPESHGISWIAGANGEDGLLLEQGGEDGRDYLVVEDIVGRSKNSGNARKPLTLMEKSSFQAGGITVTPVSTWPSPNLETVLVMSNRWHNWRHSYTGNYWLFDVKTQSGQPLDPEVPYGRIQLATWAPDSSAVMFVRDNNMYLRRIDSTKVIQITQDGGEEMFNGVPDWVYEEEVFADNSVSWWSSDSKYLAFIATNETAVPEFPVQYFLSRPSGILPPLGEEAYPEVRQIKYPKAGAPNPTVHLRFYDVEANKLFNVPITDDFPDEDRLITEVIWAGDTGKVLIRETNRESDILKMVLIDVKAQSGSIVREENVYELDGGWFEVSETTTFIPKDTANGRPDDGYIDTVIHDGFDHLAYFSPLDSDTPRLLTTGKWEVEDAPSAVDLRNNLVYFIGTRDGSTQRHVYSVSLTQPTPGSSIAALTDTSKDGYYTVSFSTSSGYALLSYYGPSIPWQKIITTPSHSGPALDVTLEANTALAERASAHELPLLLYSTITIDGVELNILERRPPHFNPKHKYPVLFYLYGGPGSQTVDKRFRVDFQAYVASTLGYIVVTLDGRGTGLLGRSVRCVVRGNIGYWEAHDQIAAAKSYASRPYVDPSRLAVWGWSYGGYLTLKVLEQDAGATFRYGMAVAPVTDWRFYDTIYTERWLHTPQHNPGGYANASVSNVSALAGNERFLVMHGVADDNVHFQNSLTLLDKLDLADITNYDVHVFPDSDHSIYFHGANRVVYEKLAWWITNAFNGEWARIRHAVPLRAGAQVGAAD